jgi:tryptophanyl-tRNA synthetase
MRRLRRPVRQSVTTLRHRLVDDTLVVEDTRRMPRFLSGIQPTSSPHIGNYFGAIAQHVEASKSAARGDAFFFIADLHALNQVHDKTVLAQNVRSVAATYLSMGLDVENAIFYRQSDIPEVTELTWLLATCTGMGLLERAHSYKDKTAKGLTPSVGLFTYPVLMAADILIYDADVVPVGKDQVQHIEMAQDMAGHFNARYGDGKALLKKPTWQLSRTPKVPGVDGEKMSSSYGNFILMFESGNALKKAVNRIVTDSRPPEEPKNPDELIAFQLLELFLDDNERAEWRTRVSTGGPTAPGYGDLKKEIMARMESVFGPARESYRAYMEDDGAHRQLEDVLQAGAERARPVAQDVLRRCKEACGLSSGRRR